MIYEIKLSDQVKLDLVRLAIETEVYVDVLSAYGHYDDK